MDLVNAVKSRLSVKISLTLAALLLLLTALAGVVITRYQTAQAEALTLEKSRLAASLGARQWGDLLDHAIDAGQLTVADVFDRNYVEVKGYAFGKQPKFHTRFDAFTDNAVLVFQDKYLDHDDFLFAVGVDENGYLPTHNSKFQKPLTGDPEKDLVGNRTKRMFNDPVGAAAAKNLEPTLQQVYRRDTGETLWDVSSPIWVKGKHWGGFRVGVSMDRLEARKRALLLTLLGMFALFALVTVGTMFAVVQRAMRPVVELTRTAEAISVGDALETPIKSASTDEIGQLTKAIDRLRASMKAAMSRLGH
jgi:HAMP domain-containing protein